ncbi:MAG: TolC family protein [Candidatus Omnitrophota bacterium]
MTLRKTIALLIGAILSVTQPVFAFEIGPEALSLEDALRIAYVNHPAMQEVKQEISAAKGRWMQAEALPDPEMEMKVGGLKKQVQDGKETRKGNVDSFLIQQPLDPLGTRFLKGRMAWDEVKISRGNVELVWARVRQEVIGFYAGILTDEKAQEIAGENLKATRQFFTQVETRYQSSNALQSDVIRAKIEVSRSENDLLVAQKNLQVSKGKMNLALGRTVESSLQLSDFLAYDSVRFQYDQIMKQAIEKRADLRNEETRLKTRAKGVWSAWLKTFLPKMGIGVERTTTDYENDTAILIGASYPLWGFNLGEVKEAKAEKTIQQVRVEALRRQVGLEVYQAFLESELADKQVALQKKALDEANELLRQITLQYEEGKIPFLSYLENIKTIKETRLAYFTALKNYKETVADLERTIQATPIPEGAK